MQAIKEILLRVVEETLVGVMEELDRSIVAGSFRFLESTVKVSHTVSHYRLMLVVSFCG